MVDVIKADQEDWIDDIGSPQQPPFSRYTIGHCHILSISTLHCEAFRDREKKRRKQKDNNNAKFINTIKRSCRKP
jgi:hypothetical protein